MKDAGTRAFPSIVVEAEVRLMDSDLVHSEASQSLDLKKVSEATDRRQINHPVEAVAVAVVQMDSFQSFEASSYSV